MLLSHFTSQSALQAVMTSVFPNRPRRRIRRQTQSNVAGMVELLEQRRVPTSTINLVATSPDGLHIAEVIATGTANVSVVEDGVTVAGNFSSVFDLQFSPQGDHLAFIGVKPNTLGAVFEDGRSVSGTFSEPTDLRFSPDGNHLAYLISNGTVHETFFEWAGVFNLGVFTFQASGTSVVEDGRLLNGTFVGVSQIQFTQTNHLVYLAETSGFVNSTFQVFQDGSAIRSFGLANGLEDSLADFTVSPDGLHTAFLVAQFSGQSGSPTSFQVVEDGHLIANGQSFASVQNLQFSASGDHLAFIGVKPNGAQVFEDGSPIAGGTTFGSASSLQFTPVGTNLAFIASSLGNTSSRVFLNSSPVAGGASFGNVNDLQFSKDGSHLAFIGFNTGRTSAQVFEDGGVVAGRSFPSVTPLLFSPVGHNLAFVGLSAGNTRAQVFENGNLVAGGTNFGSVGSLQFSADGRHLAFIGFNTGSSRAQVFEDGNLLAGSSVFGNVIDLTFSPLGANLAFIGQNIGNSSAQVFENGNLVGGPFAKAGLLQFSADGSELTFVSNGSTLGTFLVAPAVTANAANLNSTAAVLTINGVGFSGLKANDTVTLSGGATGTVISATTTQLVIGNLRHLRAGVLTAVVTSHGKSSGTPVQVATIVN